MTRKEAIETIKARFDKWTLDNEDTEAIQTLIPELADSEDEKMATRLIHLIHTGGYLEEPIRTQILAYLEKQKESLHISGTCKENADSFTDGIIEVRSFQRGLEEGRRQEREKQKELPSQSFNQEQFFAKKDSTPFEKELFLSLRAIKETKPLDEEIWLNVKEQLTPVLLSLVQKEQKVDIDKLRRDLYQSGYNDGYQHGKEDAQKEQKPDSYSFNEPYNPDDYEVVMDGNATSLKQKEQNPISQEDFDAAKTQSIVWRAERAEATEYIKRNSKEWYALLSEQYDKGYWKGKAEQKPAEWALPKDFEEAVYKVANFISPFDSQEELRKVSHRFAEQLLSLAKKELDKPAEWSDEDEKMLNLAIEWAETISDQFSFVDMNPTDFRKIIAWLKSLRPSWKPSEEQMEALRRAVNKLAKSDVADSVRLSIMYDNLKKLM